MESTIEFLLQDRRLDTKKKMWIRNNVRKRECIAFVHPKGDNSTEIYANVTSFPLAENNNHDICRCGRVREEHVRLEFKTESSDYRLFSEEVPTDVCVEAVCCKTNSLLQPPIEFLRLAADTEQEILRQIISSIWRMPKANFLVGVYGSCSTSDVFEKNLSLLLKTLASPGNVFLTLCPHSSKAFHQPFDFKNVTLLPTSEILPVSFVNWGTLPHSTKTLLTKGAVAENPLEVSEIIESFPACAEIKIGHFFMADYGVQEEKATNNFTYVFPYPLRRNVETVLRQHAHDSQRQGSLLLLTGGDFYDLVAVHSAILVGVPVVLIKYKSSGVADILMECMRFYGEDKSEVIEDGKTYIRARTIADPLQLREKVKGLALAQVSGCGQFLPQLTRIVVDCLERRHLLTTCTIDDSDNDLHALLEAAVEAFIKCRSLEDSLIFFRKNVYQLNAEHSTHPVKIAQNDFQSALIRAAIRLDYSSLLDIVANHGFVTEEIALDSIKLTSTERRPKKFVKTWKKKLTQSPEILDLNQFALREQYVETICDIKRDASPLSLVQNLFLWAVLNGKLSLACYFWKRGSDQITNALLASHLSRALSEKTTDGRMKAMYLEHAEEFECLAKGTLAACYRQDPQRACQILTQNVSGWLLSPMEAAIRFNIRSFVAEPASFAYLDAIWTGENLKNGFTKPVSRVKRPEENGGDTITIEDNGEQTKTEKRSKCKAFCAVLNAPRTKCFLATFFYILFLTLFGHVLIFKMREKLSYWEIVLIAWVFSLLVEEIVQAFWPTELLMTIGNRPKTCCEKLQIYFRDRWNILDDVAILTFVIGCILRHVSELPALEETGRVFLCLDIILFFLRLLQTLTMSRLIGPMLPMVYNMLRDLIPFLVILGVVFLAYGVASEALLHRNTEWHPLYLLYLPRLAFWPIFGEYGLEEISGTDDCKANGTLYLRDGGSMCPSRVGSHVVPVLMGFYIIITNVLMLNMLIAYFNNSFQEVHQESNIWWAWLRCGLMREYHGRCLLPPPLTLPYRLLQFVGRCCKCVLCSCCLGDSDDLHGVTVKKQGIARSTRKMTPSLKPGLQSRHMAGLSLDDDYAIYSLMPKVDQAFREDGDQLSVIDLVDFRFTTFGLDTNLDEHNQCFGVPAYLEERDITDEDKKVKIWESALASAYLRSKAKPVQQLSTMRPPVATDNQKENELISIFSRLEKKTEDNCLRLKKLEELLVRLNSEALNEKTTTV